MIFEYAIDPNLLNSIERMAFYVGRFGHTNGRLISNLPHSVDWISVVENNFNTINLSPLQKQKFREYMNYLRNSFADIPNRNFDNSQSWINNVLTEDTILPFKAIITDSPSGKSISPHSSMGINFNWEISRVEKIRLTEIKWREIIEGLLGRSSKTTIIKIIDPYFKIENESNRVLLDYISDVVRKSPRLINLEIYTSPSVFKTRENQLLTKLAFDSTSWNGKRSDWQRIIRSHRISRANIVVHVMDHGAMRFHDRYIMSNFAGIAVGLGIESSSRDTIASLLDTVAYRELYHLYSQNSPEFDHYGTFTIRK